MPEINETDNSETAAGLGKSDLLSDLLYCDFCGLEKGEVEVLICGPSAKICNKCVDHARDCIGDFRINGGK